MQRQNMNDNDITTQNVYVANDIAAKLPIILHTCID